MDPRAPFTEFAGTATFLTVILRAGQPLPIAIGLLAAIYMDGGISGGHFNPAVTFMMYLKRDIGEQTMLMYVLAQLLGAFAAFSAYQYLK